MIIVGAVPAGFIYQILWSGYRPRSISFLSQAGKFECIFVIEIGIDQKSLSNSTTAINNNKFSFAGIHCLSSKADSLKKIENERREAIDQAYTESVEKAKKEAQEQIINNVVF